MQPKSTIVIGPATHSPEDRTRQVFDGFPYLVVRLGPAVYCVIPVPAAAERGNLIALARHQALSNQLPTCLAFGLRDGVYCEPDGSVTSRDLIPRGGTQLSGPLRLGREFAPDPEQAAREARLQAYLRDRLPRSGFLMGDLTKGGRVPSEEESERLGGTRGGRPGAGARAADGVPPGLARCSVCGEWRGECLDPNPEPGPLLVRVRCLCENRNRCARCGELLSDRALDANYYDVSRGRVIHVPGFTALAHRC